jgi:acetyl esterase/lipase/ketosteroid isomerase-like protein
VGTKSATIYSRIIAMKTLLSVSSFLFLISTAAFAQTTPTVIPLWESGAPGFESKRNEPEQAKDYWVKSIHNPSLTVFLPPKEKATGAAIIIAPGGGHRELVFKAEGVEAAQYLNSIGVAAFALKYRLGREEGSPYSVQHAKEDGLRAMRLVRSRAGEWGLDRARIGMMGFSAGGEVVSMTTFGATDGAPNAADAIDRTSARPDFLVMIYPGPGGVPDMIPANAPPAFLLVANDDACCSGPVLKLLQGYRAAKLPVEAHIFAKGSHAFNMGNRSKLTTLKTWPQRLADWMGDNNILSLPATAPAPTALVAQPSVELPPALARVLKDYEAAWSTRNPAALAQLFAEDGFVLPSRQAPVRGRSAIEKYYTGHGGPLTLRALSYGVEGDVGYIIGGYAGTAGVADDGKFTLTLRKGRDGKWLIASDMDNGNHP